MAQLTLEGLIGAVDGKTQSFLAQTYPAMASAISTPIYSLAIIYWVVYGYKIYAGYEPVKWNTMLARLMMTVGIFSTLNWGGLASTIYGIFTSFMEGTAATILAGQPTSSMLDALFNTAGKIASTLQKLNIYQIGMILLGIGLLIINCILFVVALYNMTIAKFGLAITMVLLPVFVGFFFFEQTRQWGMNWISKMLNFSLIYIIVIAIVRMAFWFFGDILNDLQNVANLNDAAKVGVVGVANLCVIEGILIIFMSQAKGWAASLSGGAAIQGASSVINTALIIAGKADHSGKGK